MKKILIVEDDEDISELLKYNLEKDGYRAVVASNGREGVDLARYELPDLILLDLMLPEINGTEVCRLIKHSDRTSKIPVIMLTAKGEEIDKVVGFEIGADDYIVKPFSVRELLLRIKALFRRCSPDSQTIKPALSVGALLIDSESFNVTLAGVHLDLTSTEFKLLKYLAEHLNHVISREKLLQKVWGLDYPGDTRTVDTHITRLRNKLGDFADMIKTVRGFGYKMEMV